MFFVMLSLGGLQVAQTMLFTGFVLFELVRIWVLRSQENLTFFSNRWLLIAISISILAQLIVLYSPLGLAFGVVPLTLEYWGILIGFVSAGWILAVVITRIINRFV